MWRCILVSPLHIFTNQYFNVGLVVCYVTNGAVRLGLLDTQSDSFGIDLWLFKGVVDSHFKCLNGPAEWYLLLSCSGWIGYTDIDSGGVNIRHCGIRLSYIPLLFQPHETLLYLKIPFQVKLQDRRNSFTIILLDLLCNNWRFISSHGTKPMKIILLK